MPMSARIFLFLGSIGMLLAVAMGAFGAHALKKTLTPDLLAVYQTAVNYHVYHALGLLAVGVLVFSGSLYALSLSGIRGLGAITPFGGVALIAGWLLLAIAVVRTN